MYFINMHNLLFVDDYHQIISLESQSDPQCKVNIVNVMYFIRLRFSQQTPLGHPNIHTYIWILSQHSRGYTEEIGQHFIKNLDLGCASPGRTCNNCLFTFALFAMPWSASPSLSLSLFWHLSLSSGACLLLLSWPRAKTARPMPRQGKAQR